MARQLGSIQRWLAAASALLLTWSCGGGGGSGGGGVPGPSGEAGSFTNPLLFVTQVPVTDDFGNIASTFGSHLAHPALAPRGGDLHLLYPSGTLRNLTREAGYGVDGVQAGPNAIAVREPSVHWSGNKAVFSMVLGGPFGGQELDWYWQLYEVTGFGEGQTASITKVPNQPLDANNVSPCYASDGRILFVSDRPRAGQSHLSPQLDEYEEIPTNTGIWSLDPTSGELFQMNHSPSGSFAPIVDSFGRVVFTRWDHLERDQQADEDNMGFGSFGTFNYTGEGPGAVSAGNNEEVFPEPNKRWVDFINANPGFSGDLRGYRANLVGNRQNHFFPWTLNQDGTEEETLNHIGRQELHTFALRSVNDDFNVRDHFQFGPDVANGTPVQSFLQISEDPMDRGTYFGIDSVEFGTHAAGQVIRIRARPSRNANEVQAFAVTHPDTRGPTAQAPVSRYDFRLKYLIQNGTYSAAGAPLTGGIEKSLDYWTPYAQRHHEGPLWELDVVEVRSRATPPLTEGEVPAPELQVLSDEGIALQDLVQYLKDRDLALIVSRDVTSRDANDHQQPFNLRVAGSATETLGEPGTIYDVAHMQLYQGDLIRGLTNGPFISAGGRRVLAQPLHDAAANNPPNPGGPPGSVPIAPDGSMAALVPARRAMTWQLTDGSGEGVVRERYWVTFQPGEIRSCTSCHGLNEQDQAGGGTPANLPQALGTLLQHLKNEGEI